MDWYWFAWGVAGGVIVSFVLYLTGRIGMECNGANADNIGVHFNIGPRICCVVIVFISFIYLVASVGSTSAGVASILIVIITMAILSCIFCCIKCCRGNNAPPIVLVIVFVLMFNGCMANPDIPNRHRPEVYQIARNQRVNKKLSADQLAVMFRAAAIDAPSRRRTVVELVQQSAFDNDPWLKTFGVRIDPDMKKVDARILPAPKIQYAPGVRSPVEPRDGVWDCRGQKFIIPASCDKIGALVIDDRDHQIYKEFFSFLFGTCNEMGMRVPNQIDLSAVRAISPDSTSQIEPKLTELVQMGATFIIVTIPQKSQTGG